MINGVHDLRRHLGYHRLRNRHYYDLNRCLDVNMSRYYDWNRYLDESMSHYCDLSHCLDVNKYRYCDLSYD